MHLKNSAFKISAEIAQYTVGKTPQIQVVIHFETRLGFFPLFFDTWMLPVETSFKLNIKFETLTCNIYPEK